MEQEAVVSYVSKIDNKAKIIREKAEKLADVVNRINEILLPLSAMLPKKPEEGPKPKGWFETHLSELNSIEYVLCEAMEELARLLYAVEREEVVRKQN